MKAAADLPPGDQKIGSLQAKLAWRLGGVLVVSMSLVSATLLSYFWVTLNDMDDATLQVQARQIADNLTADGGNLVLKLPDALASAYRRSRGGIVYAIKNADGAIAIASSERARQIFAPIAPPSRLPFFFRLPNLGDDENPYYTLAVTLPNVPGRILFVAQGRIHRDVFYDTVIAEFGQDLGWVLPIILLVSLAIAIWTIRSSLAPLSEISARARHIGPRNIDIRLPLRNVPLEIRPLVEAINAALTRLEKGFLLQRQFTANAAHELRTPLAILNAQLDGLDNSKAAASLAVDIQRMNRLVEQLLRVSRLDSEPLEITADVNLNEVAAEIVGYLAPLAISRGRTIGLVPAPAPVLVRGNFPALGDALRNLIENAIEHSPKGGAVLVEVGVEGCIVVRDQGAGIADEDRENIFHRFWRGPRRSETGSGLGLAIVTETANAHGGAITFENNPVRGASFTLSLPLAP